MKKALVVAIFILAMAMVTIPSIAPENVGYNATVASGQNTVIVSTNGSFGTVLVNSSKTITNSVVLNNTGDVNATVDAKFNDSRGGVYGLVSGSNVIGAANFSLKQNPSGSWTALNNSGSNVRVALAQPFTRIGANTVLDARLFVPSGTPGGSYNGTVVLTFGDEV